MILFALSIALVKDDNLVFNTIKSFDSLLASKSVYGNFGLIDNSTKFDDQLKAVEKDLETKIFQLNMDKLHEKYRVGFQFQFKKQNQQNKENTKEKKKEKEKQNEQEQEQDKEKQKETEKGKTDNDDAIYEITGEMQLPNKDGKSECQCECKRVSKGSIVDGNKYFPDKVFVDIEKMDTTVIGVKNDVTKYSDSVIAREESINIEKEKIGRLRAVINGTIAKYRQIFIDLLPNLIYAQESFIEILIRSKVAQYVQFRGIENNFVFDNNLKVSKVPLSKSDVFLTKQLSLIEKRQLTKFMHSILNDSANPTNQVDKENDRQNANENENKNSTTETKDEKANDKSNDDPTVSTENSKMDELKTIKFSQYMTNMKLSSKLQNFIRYALAFLDGPNGLFSVVCFCFVLFILAQLVGWFLFFIWFLGF